MDSDERIKMKVFCFLLSFCAILISGCAVVNQQVVNQQPMALEEIKFADLQQATGKSINKLLMSDVLKEKENSRPFVMVGKFENKLIPHLKTEVISQDIRLAILMSDKAITMPEDVKKIDQDPEKKPAADDVGKNEALPAFDYFLSCEVVKEKWPSPDSQQECYLLRFKLKDLKTKLVIWEDDSKLVK